MNAYEHNQPNIASEAVLSGTYGPFQDNHALKVILSTGLILSAMLILFSLLARQLTPAIILAEPQHQITLLLRAIYVTGLIVNFACLPFYCLWINRSCKNAWLLNPPKMRVTPGGAVGYYFIPIVALWKPYANMIEIRNASFGMRSNLTSIIPAWWLSWLALLMLNTAQLAGGYAANPEISAISDKISSVSAIAIITLNYLSITVILSITAAQQKRAAEMQR
ncbi:MAG: DUF4328 domain-containing protein [Akkermansiaceae bacterium]|nr:DUF4328 domain-containing protein [Akkermansiaceae bacterium]